MSKILAVDDDPKILRLLKNALAINGHEVVTSEGVVNIDKLTLDTFDLILLDVMMPELDGFTFCRQNRDTILCPIVFLTAKTEETAVIQGLLSGGDDYIKKPFGIQELNARVEAHLRRDNRKKQSKLIKSGEIVINLDSHMISVNGKDITLTKNQYNICEFLASNQGIVFSKEQIFEAVYTYDSDTLFSTITEHIRAVRNKFKESGCNPIETIWGVGYKWQ